MDENNMSQKKLRQEKLKRLGIVLCIFLGLGIIGNVVQHLAGLSGEPAPEETAETTEAPTEPRAMAEKLQVPTDGLRDLKIDWVAGTVTVAAAPVETIEIQETEARKKLDYVIRDGELLIRYSKDSMQSLLGIHSKNGKDLVVLVPESWDLDILRLQSGSAAVTLKELDLKDLEYDGVAGGLDAEDCRLGRADLRTVSGNLRLSGSLDSLSCQGVSGSLALILPEDLGFALELEGVSAELDTDFPVTEQEDGFRFGDGSCPIHVKGISGGLSIRKAG